jgi:competence protein ComEC
LLLLGAVGAAVGLRFSAARRRRAGRAGQVWAWLTFAGAIAIAFAQTELRAHARLEDRLASPLERVELEVVGVVVDLPTRRSDAVRLRLQVESATRVSDGSAVRLPDLIALGWYADARAAMAVDDDPATPPDLQVLRAGERWRLRVRLGAPHGLFNPGGFDHELWLFEQGIGASGTVRTRQGLPAQRLDAAAGAPLQRMRQALRDAIQARLGDTRAAGVVAALCVGDQAGISRQDWDIFRSTGIAHLVAISGLHLTMLAWLAALLVRRAWPLHAHLALWLAAPHAARLAGVLVALAYAALAGWGVPAQRTVFMIAVAALTPLLGLRWPWPLTLGAAAWVVAVLDPWALLQPGFWLSFVAVGLLMLQGDPGGAAGAGPQAATPPARLNTSSAKAVPVEAQAGGAAAPALQGLASAGQRAGRALWCSAAAGVRTQAVATVGLAPLSLLFFHQLALIGFVANLLAIPLVTLVITPLVLLGCVLHPLWDLAAWLVDVQGLYLAWLAGVPMASWQPPAAPAWAQALALLGAVLLLLPAPWALRLTGLPLVVPLLWPALPRPADGEFDLLGADVGQGQAVIVRTRTHQLLYDAGGLYSRDSDAGERVLVPLLRNLGLAPLDLLMLSHRDTDHVGGARAVLAGVGATALTSSLEVDHPLLRQGLPHRRCLAGQHWRWDGVDFELLHPTERDYERYAAGHLRPNGLSCVLRVTNGARTALLLGDVEQPQEMDILARSAPRLHADVMLVAHHGSRTSSDAIFLQAVAPRWGLVQAGHHNRYGHPAPDVLERLRTHGIEVVRTDFCGAWHWDSANARPWCQRDRDRRYWHAPIRGVGLELASSASNNSPP